MIVVDKFKQLEFKVKLYLIKIMYTNTKNIGQFLTVITVITLLMTGCIKTITDDKLPVESNQYDSICTEYNSLYNKYDSLEFYSRITNDSLTDICRTQKYVIDSLEEELLIANYKLERIREYNRIAAQGNNITFLRGWINRVLKD